MRNEQLFIIENIQLLKKYEELIWLQFAQLWSKAGSSLVRNIWINRRALGLESCFSSMSEITRYHQRAGEHLNEAISTDTDWD